MELEEQEQVAAERLEEARAALAAEKQRAKAVALEEKEERVSLLEHQRLQVRFITVAYQASRPRSLVGTHARSTAMPCEWLVDCCLVCVF